MHNSKAFIAHCKSYLNESFDTTSNNASTISDVRCELNLPVLNINSPAQIVY